MNKLTLRKSTFCFMILVALLFSCSKSNDNNVSSQKKIPKQTTINSNTVQIPNNKNSDLPLDKNIKLLAELSDINKIKKKANDYNSSLDLMSFSDSNMLMQVENVINNGDINEIAKLFRILIDSQDYKMALHLATNALANANLPEEKAECVVMTLRSFLGAEDDDSNQQVADNALNVLININDRLGEKYKTYFWESTILEYSSICQSNYKNIDKTLQTITLAEKYLNKKKAKWHKETIYRSIGYRLAYSKKLEEYTISESTLKQLSAYAQSLDDDMIPECIKKLPDYIDNGERRLKPLLLKGINRYEKMYDK